MNPKRAVNVWLLLLALPTGSSCAAVKVADEAVVLEEPEHKPIVEDAWLVANRWLEKPANAEVLSGLGADASVERVRWTGAVYEVVVVGEHPDKDGPAILVTIGLIGQEWRVTKTESTTTTSAWPVF
jgi:hypothetical protein